MDELRLQMEDAQVLAAHVSTRDAPRRYIIVNQSCQNISALPPCVYALAFMNVYNIISSFRSWCMVDYEEDETPSPPPPITYMIGMIIRICHGKLTRHIFLDDLSSLNIYRK